MPDPRVEDLERAAALHWQAPETEPLGEWRLRAAAGFTGRANSALPVGDPGLPLAEAVTAVEDWYRRRDLRPMIVLPQGAGPDPLPAYLAERSWVPRPAPAFVMTAEIADLPANTADMTLAPEPDAAVPSRSPPGRSRGGSFPRRSFARSSLLAPQSSRRRGPSARRRPRPPLHTAHPRLAVVSGVPCASPTSSDPSSGLAAAAGQGARRMLLQVETGNAPARALYLRCGFRDSHRYHYMLAP
jgi:N-acetylglutamate synthase